MCLYVFSMIFLPFRHLHSGVLRVYEGNKTVTTTSVISKSKFLTLRRVIRRSRLKEKDYGMYMTVDGKYH